MKLSTYASSLSDVEWALLQPLVPTIRDKGFGRSHRWTRRAILDGIFYILRSGCQWRMMPADLPHWNSCYRYYRLWRKDGTWVRIHDTLHGDVRAAAGRARTPSLGLLDSQSVKTTETAAVVGAGGTPTAQSPRFATVPKKRSRATGADSMRENSRRGASET